MLGEVGGPERFSDDWRSVLLRVGHGWSSLCRDEWPGVVDGHAGGFQGDGAAEEPGGDGDGQVGCGRQRNRASAIVNEWAQGHRAGRCSVHAARSE